MDSFIKVIWPRLSIRHLKGPVRGACCALRGMVLSGDFVIPFAFLLFLR